MPESASSTFIPIRVCWAAPSEGVLVVAPENKPAAARKAIPKILAKIAVRNPPPITIAAARLFSTSP